MSIETKYHPMLALGLGLTIEDVNENGVYDAGDQLYIYNVAEEKRNTDPAAIKAALRKSGILDIPAGTPLRPLGSYVHNISEAAKMANRIDESENIGADNTTAVEQKIALALAFAKKAGIKVNQARVNEITKTAHTHAATAMLDIALERAENNDKDSMETYLQYAIKHAEKASISIDTRVKEIRKSFSGK